MPNWCATTVILTGNKENIEKANEAISDILSVPPIRTAGPGWLGYLNEFIYPEKFDFHAFLKQLKDSTIDRRQILTDDRIRLYMHTDCRGWIQDCRMDEMYDGSKRWQLQLSIEDAWGPHEYIVSLFALKYDLELNMLWEEPGMQVGGKLDTDNVFTESDVIVDYNIPSSLDLGDASFITSDGGIVYCTFEELNSDIPWPAAFNKYRHDNNIELHIDNVHEHISKFMEYLEKSVENVDTADWWFNVNEFDCDLNNLDLAYEIPEYSTPESTE